MIGHRAAVGAVAALLLAGCTADPPDVDAPRPTLSATPSPAVPEPPPPGPLEVYVGYVDVVRSAEEWVAEITWRENRTAACMTGLGFEYDPQVPTADQITFDDGPVQGTREFVGRWGYGIWVPPPGGSGGGFSYSSGDDPNWERLEAMSDAGREAYLTALWGPVTETSDDGAVTRSGGCSEAREVPDGPEAAYLIGVRDEARAFLAALPGDGRFADVDTAWASCMADAGLAFATPQAAQQHVMDEMLTEIEDGVLDPDVVAERAPEELRLAVADLDCQEATDWVARHRAIELEIQQEYVDAHRADLDALAAALPAPPATG